MTQALLLLLIGFGSGLAGVLTSVASLISYPALLAMGLPPVSANVTNTMAVLFTGAGAAAGSRPELAGKREVVLRLSALAAVGGAIGAALLLLAPASTFHVVVPFLIGGSSLFLLAQPYLARRRAEHATDPPHRPARWLYLAFLASAVYTGYFGAAGAVMILAILAAMYPAWTAQQSNAVKALVSFAGNGAAAIGFAFFGPVHWAFVIPLALGSFLGGRIGPSLARRMPGTALRILAATCGLAMAVKFAL
ncbi:sulfite exporter TauE/SafE family protein [Nocardia sp. NPDC020380]|uniref:sulfite exporter TauE/SafE family protein n=1 Tax=Nocardia sp. NPDC020380 TaxID=3364309 RepID=UPI0037AB225B